MIIRDKFGREQTLTWLYEQFGPIVIDEPPDPSWEIAELRENDDLDLNAYAEADDTYQIQAPAAIIVTIQDRDGSPLPDVAVVFSWPDAPPLPGAGWDERGVTGKTNATGQIDFAMGGGAYYDPHHTRGPHDLWLFGPGVSPILRGLGMIAGTNHRHLDVLFQPLGPDEPPMPPPNDLRYHLCQAIQSALLVDQLLQQAEAAQARALVHLRALQALLEIDCHDILLLRDAGT